jgi:hypothetical protein
MSDVYTNVFKGCGFAKKIQAGVQPDIQGVAVDNFLAL